MLARLAVLNVEADLDFLSFSEKFPHCDLKEVPEIGGGESAPASPTIPHRLPVCVAQGLQACTPVRWDFGQRALITERLVETPAGWAARPRLPLGLAWPLI